ncbi:FAD-binding protein [Photobacterium leiognathi]|uniref:FAD-binding protein n=1 Tax=Photobacterium leiognathi TaxID=553611 RepID=UPI002980AAA4|nr:FAD-binding protein [Photobacterium leiognathi]
MSNQQYIEDTLFKNHIPFIKNYDLKSNCYSKTGYLVENYIMPKTVSELEFVISLFRTKNIAYKVIGETTNVIFLDSVIYSNIISTKLITTIKFKENEVVVACGKNLPDFVRELSMRSYTGFEGLEGIPGTVGGAVFMNAGAYGYEISDNIKSVSFINLKGELEIYNKEMLNFKRRGSFFKENKNCIILNITFNLKLGDSEDIYKKIERFHIARHKYQEWVYPNLGSIYSSERSIYDSSSSCNKYIFKLKFIRKIFYGNPIAKYYNRLYPSNERLNKLFLSHFKMSDFAEFPSRKNINTFINKNHSTLEIMQYISKLGGVLDSDTYLENELIIEPIFKVIDHSEFNNTVEVYDIASKKNSDGE